LKHPKNPVTRLWTGTSAAKPAKNGATPPAICDIGEFFFSTAAAAGQNLYLCASANTWTEVSGNGGGASAVGGDLSGAHCRRNRTGHSRVVAVIRGSVHPSGIGVEWVDVAAQTQRRRW
jgi:hypothetical protein